MSITDEEEVAPPDEAVATVGPPLVFLVLAGASVVASIALLPMGGLRPHVAGYVLASLLPILCVGVFRRVDLRRRAEVGYRDRPWVDRFVPLALVAAIVVTALHTWAIATDIAT